MIRNALKKEMWEVVKGWGVWVETIEITDVKILSSSLFKDLQSKFREEQKQKAEMEKLVINEQIECEKLKSELAMNEKRTSSDITKKIFTAKNDLVTARENSKI